MQNGNGKSGCKKNPWWFVFAAVSVLGGLGLLGYLAAWLIGTVLGGLSLTVPAATVGIIGGADGPTAVFVTAAAGPAWEWVLYAGMLAAGIIGCRRLNRTKQ